MSGLKNLFFESSSSLTTFNVSIGPNKSFNGAKGVTISVLGQTEFSLTNGTLIGSDISGILKVPSSVPISNIQSVSVGTTVTSIGDNAFNSVTSLKTVSFVVGSKLTSIGENAFQNATNLTTLRVPAPVTSIGDYAFYGANKLTSITFDPGSQLDSIGVNAFYQATTLTSITIPAFVTSIGLNAFSGSGLKTVVFDSMKNLTSLGNINGFTFGVGQPFFGATGVTISAVGYSRKTDITNYYYPGVTSSPISIDTKGYTRCDVLIVGSGGSAGNTLVGNLSPPTILFGGGGGGGGSASFTNIPCNPIDGKIEFTITQSESSWVLNNWVKDGTDIKCNLTAENGGNGSSYILKGNTATGGAGGAGGAGGSTAKSDIGLLNTLSLPVKLTGNSGKPGSGEKTIRGDTPSSLPSYVSGGDPGAILTNFKAPLDKKYGKGSSNQKITITRLATSSIVYPEDPPGQAFIQVNLYTV
jgi:hypothetical protein